MKKSTLYYSILTAILIAITAVFGLLVPETYQRESANWTAQAKAEDWIDLIIVFPGLIITSLLAYRKSAVARLCRLGLLLYTIYAFILYGFAVHFNFLFPAYVAVLGLSVFLAISELSGYDHEALKERTRENWSRTGAGILLIVKGVLFYFLWGKDIVSNLIAGTVPQEIIDIGMPTNAVWVIDTSVALPALIYAGYLLLKRRPLGYALGGALLVFMTVMSTNILFLMWYMAQCGFAPNAAGMSMMSFMLVVDLIITVSFMKTVSNRTETTSQDKP